MIRLRGELACQMEKANVIKRDQGEDPGQQDKGQWGTGRTSQGPGLLLVGETKAGLWLKWQI